MFFALGHLLSLSLLAFTRVLADPDSYVAVPKDRHDKSQTDATDASIKGLLGAANVYSYVSPTEGLAFWYAPMTKDQQTKVAALPGVDHIWKDDVDGLDGESTIPREDFTRNEAAESLNILRKREGTIQHRPDSSNGPAVVDDLKFVSWASGKAWKDIKDYAFDDAAGADTWVYLIENGVNLENSEIAGNKPQTPFFYGPSLPPPKKTDTDDSPKGHGTCMASKAAGPNLGVASQAHMIVLKAHTLADSQWAFEKARDDIVSQGRQQKSVILFARGPLICEPGQENQSPWKELKPLILDLFSKDIVVVTSSGNLGAAPGHSQIDCPIKTFAGPNYPLIVVGAVTNEGLVAIKPGDKTSFSQGGPQLTVSAPGLDVMCADSANNNTPRKDTGTSPAAAMTAGLVAYFLSFRNNRPFPVGGGNTAMNARNYLQNTAMWKRPGGQDNGIWNMVDSLNAAAGAPDAPVASAPASSTTSAPAAVVTPWCTNHKRTGAHDDYQIAIHGMTGGILQFFHDNHASDLFQQESGCGTSNSWTWIWDNDQHTVGSVTFNMPWGIKGGCIERAFMTAAKGGPQIATCQQI